MSLGPRVPTQRVLVQETATAFSSFAFDPAGLVTACRRIIERHPAVGPLWWLATRVLTAGDPTDEAWRCVDELDNDPTASELAPGYPMRPPSALSAGPRPSATGSRRGDLEVLVVDVLDEGSGLVRRLHHAEVEATEVPVAGLGAAAAAADLVLLEATAIGPAGFVGVQGSRAATSVAYCAEQPVWLVGGVGRLLPSLLFNALAGRVLADDDPWQLDDEVVPLGLLTHMVGPWGVLAPADALDHTDCPMAAELLKTVAF